VRDAAVKAIAKLTTPFKKGYVPPGVVNWNDADDNNAFHAKLIVMDFDGSLSTEVALYKKKEEYDDIVTRGMPLGNDGKEVPSRCRSLAPWYRRVRKTSRSPRSFSNTRFSRRC